MSLDLAITMLQTEAFERGKELGLSSAQSINVSDGYDRHQFVVVLTGQTKGMIRNQVAARQWRNYGDNPGSAYLGTCEVLRYLKIESGWQAICLSSVYFDV